MKVINTPIPGLLILEPTLHTDPRGYFMETFNIDTFTELIGPVRFVQDNESLSTKGVVRGLHFQRPPHAQTKLVRCVQGEVLDIALDLRKGSPTFGRHFSCLLSGENHRQFFLPKGLAHGFAVLSDKALFQYKCDALYHPQSEGGIDCTDPDLAIDWQVSPTQMILSPKDTQNPKLKDFLSPFTF